MKKLYKIVVVTEMVERFSGKPKEPALRHTEELEQELCELGEQGWEFAGTITRPYKDGQVDDILMKREVLEPSACPTPLG